FSFCCFASRPSSTSSMSIRFALRRRRFAMLRTWVATFETAVRLAGWVPFIEASLGYAHARAGDRPRAEQILARLQTRGLTGYVSPIDLAQIHLGLHNRDATIGLLEEAYRTRTVRTLIIGDPFFSE